MSQTPLKGIKMTEKDLQTLSALKLPSSPQNPQKLKDFLAGKQKQVKYSDLSMQFLQSSYNT